MLKPLIEKVCSTIMEDLLHDPIKMAQSIVSSTIWCTIDVSDLEYSVRPEVWKRYFKRIPRKLSVDYNHEKNVVLEDRDSKITGIFIDSYVYRGTRIFLEKQNTSKEHGHNGIQTTLKFRVYNSQKNIDHMIDFIKMIRQESIELDDKKYSNIYRRFVDNGRAAIEYIRPQPRSFDDVFIPSEKQDQLINALKKFVSSKKWYNDHKIPYHFGILLHGEPGTGKSSIIQAILHEIEADVFYISADMVMFVFCDENDHWFRRDNKRTKIVIIEDIDAAAVSKDRKKTAKEKVAYDVDSSAVISARSIASLLNFMDGFDNPENMIYIITTNHVEDLDPALIRPGRIDLSMYIGYIDNEVFDKFVCYHYGKHIPDTFEIRSGLTCAELQTKVMEGMTFEDILEYARAK